MCTLTLPGYMPPGRSARCCGCGSAQRSYDVVSPFPLSASCCISCGCGTCWDSPGQGWGHTGQRGGPSAHCSLLASPRLPGLQCVPAKWALGCSLLCLGNPKTAEMLVPRREEEPRVAPRQPCPSHLSHRPLAAGTAGPPSLVCARGAPPAPGPHRQFVNL